MYIRSWLLARKSSKLVLRFYFGTTWSCYVTFQFMHTKLLMLPVDFKLIWQNDAPILLYGFEVWCPQMSELITKLQVRFCKIVLNLKEKVNADKYDSRWVRAYPMEIQAKSRMLCFWYKISRNVQNRDKLSTLMHYSLLSMYDKKCLQNILFEMYWGHLK